MIACFCENLEPENITISGEDYRHLVSALRVKLNQKVKLINGSGSYRISTVDRISKKEVSFTGGEIKFQERKYQIDILLSPPKREALNDCMRMACELGVRNIYLFNTEYTQNKKIDLDRIFKILKSSVVQSNNLYLPNVQKIEALENLDKKYELSIVFHLDLENQAPLFTPSSQSEHLLIIGPEGGLSLTDIELIKKNIPQTRVAHMNTPIMRTPTALCAAFSWFISKM